MVKKQIKSKARISVKKKRWYSVQAPKVLNEVIFGETLAAESSALIGKGFTVNLGTISRGPRNQNITVKFKVTELKASKVVSLAEAKPQIAQYLQQQSEKTALEAFIKKVQEEGQIKYLLEEPAAQS